MMFGKKEFKSSGTRIVRGNTIEQHMAGKSPDSSAFTFNFCPRGTWRKKAIAAVLTGLLCVGSGVLPWFLWGPGMMGYLAKADYALEKAPWIAIAALLLLYSIWVISAGIRAIICMTWAEDQLALDQEALWLLQKRGPLVSSLTIPRKNIRSLFIEPANSMIMIVLKSNLIPLTSFGTHAEQNQAVVQLCKALALPDNSTSVLHECLPSSWHETDGPNGERLVIQNPKTRREQALVLAILTAMVWLGLILLCRERQSEPNLMAVELGLLLLGSWMVRVTIWMFWGRDEWRIEHEKLIHQLRFASTVTELSEARALKLSRISFQFPGEDELISYHLKAVNLVELSFRSFRISPQKSTRIESSLDLGELRQLAHWLSHQAGIPLHDNVLNHRR
jgi:hypothetical protein